jgi:predicted PurR-regulated permease PerM
MRTSDSIVAAAACVVIIAGMKAATVILVPFLLSAFIAIISAPPMFWLQQKGVPSILAVSIVVLITLGMGVLLGTLVGQSINDFSQDLRSIRPKSRRRWPRCWPMPTGWESTPNPLPLLKSLTPALP